jgi:hypothetical protein
VHSLGLGLFEDKEKIHWFHDIGTPTLLGIWWLTVQDIIIFRISIVLLVRSVVDVMRANSLGWALG